MFFHILNIIAPVFLVIGTGYLLVRLKLFADGMIDGLMRFAILVAIPCLLFNAVANMDLGAAFNAKLLLAFYGGAALSFLTASLIARQYFSRPRGEAVAVGFAALFSNLVLLGLPISTRAWVGQDIAPLYALVSLHAPFCYLLGITTMELLRSDGRSLHETAGVVVKSMFRNSLMIGIGLGFIANLSGLASVLPDMLIGAISTLSSAALPVALFALGGILTRYKLSAALGEISTIALISLFVHPLLTLLFCKLLGLEPMLTAMVVLMASMPTGLNSFLFATMYQRGQGTAAGVVLLATMIAVFSVSFWLWWLV